MNFTSEFSNTEQWFLIVFLILYLIFLGRIFWIASRLETSASSSVLKFLLRGVYFGLMILALLNPSFGELKGTIKAQGKDILLLIDISKSMDATDIQPSRLEKAKFEINRFVNHFNNDRIGLIVFSEDALMLAPLTFDNNAINYLIPKINTDLLPEGGTNFTPALELAVDRLSKAKAKTQSKVIVFISDGENFGVENNVITKQIRLKGINFFTVGVGTKEGTTIKEGNTFKKDKDGKVVQTKLETASLKKLTKDTKGNYLEINSVSESMNELIIGVENIQTDIVDERQIDVIANKYFYFLIIALFLLGIDVFFTVRTFQL